MEKIKNRLIEYDRNLTVRKRISVSNSVMFLIPVCITALMLLLCIGAAYFTFTKLYLPSLGISIEGLKAMGEQYESALASFGYIVAGLLAVLLAVVILSIIVTNRFLTEFVIKRITEPLDIITEGVQRVKSGDLDSRIEYGRNDEFRPVTETVNLMTEKLRQSADRAAAEEQSRRELYAGISHDLRSPLTGIRAYTEALLDGVAKSPEDEQRYLRRIHARELDIERMVEQIFVFSKMEMMDFPTDMQDVSLRDELLRVAAKNPMDCAAVNLDGVPPVSVKADPFLLQRAVINLLENSRKYRTAAAANITVTAKAAAGRVIIDFADDGPGVAAEYLSKLFDAFYRADPSRRNPSGGSGLGLAVVKKAVALMGGTVSAKNGSEGGLVIEMILQEANSEQDTDNRG